jgi:hypothetical protein
MGLEKVTNDDFQITTWLDLGRFAPFQFERDARRTRIRLFWRRIIVWALALALVGWIALGSAAFWFVRYHRGYTTVRFSHVLLYPWLKEDYRHAKYRFLMTRGKIAYSKGKYLDAFYDMRLGLSVFPDDTDARRKVAALYAGVKRFDLAELMWLDGLNYHSGNRRYVTEVCAYLFSLQRDDQVIAETRRLLAHASDDVNLRHVLIMAQATAHFYRGRYSAAEAVLREYQKSRTRDDSVLRTRIAVARGQNERAVAMFAELARRLPRDDEIYKLRVALLQQLGRDADIRSLCILRQLEQPGHPQAFLDALTTLDPVHDAARWTSAVDEIFTRFPDHPDSMKELAAFAAARGRPELARRVYLHCRAHKLPWSHAASSWLAAQLTLRDYPGVLLAAQTIYDENPEWEREHGIELNALRAVASFALGDTAVAELQLQSYLTQVEPGTHDLPALAERFVAVSAEGLARTVLAHALDADEFNQAALTRWVELSATQLITAEALERTGRLLTMRQPSLTALSALRASLQSDTYAMLPGRAELLTQLDKGLGPSAR